MRNPTERRECIFARVSPNTRALLVQHCGDEGVRSMARLMERMIALYDHIVGAGPEPEWLADAKRRRIR